MSRPEHQAPPEIFYGDDEATKYTANSRIQAIQASMTERAIQLLALPAWKQRTGALLLDIGCGSGLSGEILSEMGHHWVGVDISPSMLEVALEREVEGDLLLGDTGQGLGFRPGSFDGVISISVLQWLCNADTSTASPPARLAAFFTSLHASLTRGARAVFQFYPESDAQVQLIMKTATRAGFGGGLVVDYPNSRKAKKFFLVLWTGGAMDKPPGIDAISEEEISQLNDPSLNERLPKGLSAEHEEDLDDVGRTSVKFENSRARDKGSKGKKSKGKSKSKNEMKGNRDWVMRKKELYRKRGKEDVPNDSRYTGRKRKPVF